MLAACALAQNPPSESQIPIPPPDYAQYDDTWLRHNLLLGPEVTFTNDILESLTIPIPDHTERDRSRTGSYSFPADIEILKEDLLKWGFSPAHAQEIRRFIQTVLDPTEGEFRVNFDDIHSTTVDVSQHPYRFNSEGTAPTCFSECGFMFFFKLKDGKAGVMDIEEGALEINFPPQTYTTLDRTWRDIFEQANKNGFYGYTGYAGGGGGGHLHLGFKRPQDNMFLKDTRILAMLLSLPMRVPGIFYFLNDWSDYGRDSNVPTPYDFDTDTAITFLSYINKIASAPFTLSTLEMMTPRNLTEHAFYISLARFFDHTHSDSRIEIRLQRSYNSLADLKAAALFWLRSIHYMHWHSYHQPLSTHDLLPSYDGNNIFTPLYRAAPSTHRRTFVDWMQRIRLSHRTQGRLLRYGGDDVFEPHTVNTSSPDLANIRIHSGLGHTSSLPFEVILPIPSEIRSHTTSLIINGQAIIVNIDPHTKTASVTLNIHPSGQSFVVSYVDENLKILKTFVLSAKAIDTFGHFQFSAGSDVSRIMRRNNFFTELAVASVTQANLLRTQLESAGISSRRSGNLIRRMRMRGTDELALIYESVSDGTVPTDLSINGHPAPYRRYHLGQRVIYVISDILPRRSDPYYIVLTSTSNIGDELWSPKSSLLLIDNSQQFERMSVLDYTNRIPSSVTLEDIKKHILIAPIGDPPGFERHLSYLLKPLLSKIATARQIRSFIKWYIKQPRCTPSPKQ